MFNSQFNIQTIAAFSLVSSLSLLSCKTTSASDQKSTSSSFDLSCEIPSDANQKTFVYIQTLSDLEEGNTGTSRKTLIEWQQQQKTSAGIAVTSERQIFPYNVLQDEQTDLLWKGKGFQLSMTPTPTVKSSTKVGTCTQIWSKKAAVITPRCNAVGTSAQGWYAGGKLVRYDKNCHTATLACGASDSQGWFLQKKTNTVMVHKERCSWQKTTPACTTRSGITGWYLKDRFVAKDDDCHGKSIECSSSSDGEGWVSYKRSLPQFYAEAKCLESVKTARITH